MKRNSGFTLIELLIVVAILGILGAILFVAIGGNPQRDARDSNRLTTVSQLQLALELYKNQETTYPATLAGLTAPPSGGQFIGSVPSDPKTGAAYLYAVDGTASAYHLGVVLENTSNKALCADADEDSSATGLAWTNGFNGAGASGQTVCGGASTGDAGTASATEPEYDVRS